MKIKDLIERLSKLPQDATIGTMQFDKYDRLKGNPVIFIRENGEFEIETGDMYLDYYID